MLRNGGVFSGVSAGQTWCATNLFVAALYIVEGLFKAPPLYEPEAFSRRLLASLGASLRATKRNVKLL
jgi:hypothetical protein